MARIIRDAVHGYIELCPVQQCVMGARAFQRLRYIRQNDVGYLTYPGLTHTRFEHSLGTSCFARKLWKAALQNDRSDQSVVDKIVSDAKEVVPRISRWEPKRILEHLERCLVLFGMIHDIGHLPFSHLTESALYGLEKGIYDNWAEADEFGALHEFAGFIVLRTNRELRRLLRACGLSRFEEVITGLFRETRYAPPICKTLKTFLSSEIDADRLDYLIRDGQCIGEEWGRFDLDRILLNLRLVPKGGQLTLIPRLQATSAVEAFFTERFRQYQWVHFHHKSVFYGAAFSRLLHLATSYARDGCAHVSLPGFHCKNYVTPRGYFDDSVLWNNLVRREIAPLLQGRWVSLARALREALLFRAERSVSLWKRLHDYQAFSTKVEHGLVQLLRSQWSRSRDGETLSNDRIAQSFSKESLLNAFARSAQFENDPNSLVKLEEDYVNANGEPDVYVIIQLPHFAPFKTRYERGAGDVCDVFLWDEGSSRFDSVTDVSQIVASLEAAWKRGIGLFAFAVDLTGAELTSDRKNSMLEKGQQMLQDGLEKWFREQSSVAGLIDR